ncbi:glycoside hydrolase family 11 protein [Ruminococcus sp.]|uniref:glycoside hydrolase family 11 protein n=1 Tax=Ruminococcus sp. TaxID=41978 RepID=UPI0025FA2A88|nr:glycoside hydrolase family 11 protein [Ruminococcus sp.]
MKISKFKKVISGTVSLLMIASSVPFSSSAAVGNIDLGSVSDNKVEGGFGGQAGGWDMGGNGGFDMSQFGGQGGFDMSQFGGQGGFDMSQFGGQGGFDMSQFGGQGGFDMSQFGGQGGAGGFDMSQFGGGNAGGGMDWSGFAGGFNGGGANIGGDAGNGGNAQSGLNAKIKGDMPTTVPSGVEKSSQCKVEKKSYMCKYTGKQKNCNVILPPNYDPSKKYPVMFILHGIMGSENDMVSGMGVQELMTGLMSSGQAEEFIAVTPNMFTSKTMNSPSGINQQTCAEYDNFLYDVTESLLPFIKENYSVKEGREYTAITGFSMGGREAIYCGIMRPDVFGYVGGACPAPGITPGTDSFMSHPGCMQESEFKFRDVGPEPEVFMITGGTNDSVVGTFPSQYSSILTKNGVNHVYQSIPGGGHGAESVKPHLYTFMRYAFKSSEGGSSVVTTEPVVTTTTTKPTTIATTTTTTTTVKAVDLKEELNSKVSKWGDANGDGSIDMADAVAIMQSLANPNKYKLSDQGKFNADVYEAGGGVTSNDAAAIQKYLLGLIKSLPESYSDDIKTVTTSEAPKPTTTTTKATTTTTTTKVTTTTPKVTTTKGTSPSGQKFTVGNGKTQYKADNVDGYSYEIWLDNTGGSGSMTLGSGGTFSTEWSAQVSRGNFLARRGRNYDRTKKATDVGTIVMDYAAEYSASSQGNSRLCVYGWMTDPLVEYYIIEDWVNWCPSPNGQSKTVTIDGAQYEIFQLDHTGPTILGTNETFKQYFSVRKSKRTSGTITVSDHFKAWKEAGWNIGNLTEVALNVEGWESSGKANVTKLEITSGSGSNNSQQNDNQQNNNQQNNDQQNDKPKVDTSKKLCAISFDDGASASSKSDPGYRIIDALIKNNMTATFFIVSDWIKTNDQIKYEYENGMEVANHTKTHPHLGSMGSSQIRSEWEQCNSKLKGIIGTEPSHLMRLPYLESNGTVQSALYDIPLISCAIDTQDWNNASKDQIVNTIKQAAQNGSLEGAIVLCHENYQTTAAAMEEVLPWLAQNGYQNVNITDMAKAHGKTLAGGQVHTRA